MTTVIDLFQLSFWKIPFTQPQTDLSHLYKGLWKNQFPILGKIRVKIPKYTCDTCTINATSVLQNVCLRSEPDRYKNNVNIIPEIKSINCTTTTQSFIIIVEDCDLSTYLIRISAALLVFIFPFNRCSGDFT